MSPPIRLAAVGVNHGHIYGMVNMLLAEGAELHAVHAPEPELLQEFMQRFPQAKVCPDAAEIYEDSEVDLVLTSAVPSRRAGIALQAMQHGKDVLSDKGGMTTLAQWSQVKQMQADTGCIYAIAYSERHGSRATVRALELARAGAIGEVIQTMGTGPHSLRAHSRPDWFFRKLDYGGIICDIATHQFDQYLAFGQEPNPRILAAQVANRAHPEFPELEDFGDVLLGGDVCSGYMRVDWFSPSGLATWGDTRLIVLGTEGYMEVRKNINVGHPDSKGDHLYIVDAHSARYEDCRNVELPYGRLLLEDIRNRTETAMSQAHCFAAMRLALEAQDLADTGRGLGLTGSFPRDQLAS